jgi:hypothetical protein
MEVGQAVVIDALFFMLLCGSAAAILFWASSMYGEKSYNAYRYMYLNDYETSVMSTLSKMGYTQAGVSKSWLDELGKYVEGKEFDETHPRYKALVDEWVKFCLQSPVPITLEVYNEKETPRGNMQDHLFFACPLSPKGINPKVYHGESVYSLKVVADKDGKSGTDGTVLDSTYDYIYAKRDAKGVVTSSPVCNPSCDTPQGSASSEFACSESFCAPEATEPPYFASSVQRKLCSDLICVMQTKVYY